MSDTTKMELFTAQVCPYAHRTRLVLLEKGLDFELIEVDLQNKPERFLQVSAYGKVPALVHDGVEIYESAIINEYLDEVFPKPSLMPRDPRLRAQARIWIDYCDDHFLGDHYAALKNQDQAKNTAWKDKIHTHLRRIEQGMRDLSPDGPYWLGPSASLLDFAYYPFFERLPAWAHYRGLGLPDDCTRIRDWLTVMAERPSVRAIANPPDYYIERYARYAAAPAAAE
jgi:glutathione S-transferase